MGENCLSSTPDHLRRVGYWITAKKSRRLHFDAFEKICRNAGIELVKLDFGRSLEEQGPFDLILHKLTDQLSPSLGEDQEVLKWMDMLQRYVQMHLEIPVVDPIENIMRLQDRRRQYEFVSQSDVIDGHPYFFIPSFAVLTSTDLDENKRIIAGSGLTYPLVSKPQHVAGQMEVEEMCIIFNEAGLCDVVPPCVVQSFVNHNARLFKIFITGNRHFVIQRPSIRNSYPSGRKTIFFNSCDVSKSNSSSFLNLMTDSEVEYPIIEPDKHRLLQLSAGIQKLFGLELLGIDVIIANKTGRYAVIDINVFPGYDGVKDFFPALLAVFERRIAGGGGVEHDTVDVRLEAVSPFYLPLAGDAFHYNCSNHSDAHISSDDNSNCLPLSSSDVDACCRKAEPSETFARDGIRLLDGN